jgi:Protein of unknown function (DUF2934)
MNDRMQARIRERAYEIFLQRGGGPGDALRDWLRAEREIREDDNRYRGPARMLNRTHHGKLTQPDGCDIENPT